MMKAETNEAATMPLVLTDEPGDVCGCVGDATSHALEIPSMCVYPGRQVHSKPSMFTADSQIVVTVSHPDVPKSQRERDDAGASVDERVVLSL